MAVHHVDVDRVYAGRFKLAHLVGELTEAAAHDGRRKVVGPPSMGRHRLLSLDALAPQVLSRQIQPATTGIAAV